MIVSLSDVHIPFEDKSAVDAALEFIQREKPHTIVLNGDIIDFYTISRYDKDPKRIIDLQSDIDKAKEFLKEVVRVKTTDAKIIFIRGNHEDRLEKWLMHHPEISQLKCLALEELLGFKELGIVNGSHNGRRYQYKDSLIIHGTVVRGNAGYSAMGELVRWGVSGVSGHTHRLAKVHTRNHAGTISWIEQGCLCNLDADYITSVANWTQGFAVGIDTDKEHVEVFPIRIIEGRVQW